MESLSEKETQLANLRSKFISRLGDKLTEIQGIRQELESGSDDAELVMQLHRTIHSLAGSAGTFGFDELTQRSNVIETLLIDLQKDPFDSSKITPEINVLIDSLLEQVKILLRS